MEINDANLASLRGLILQTLNSNNKFRKEGESQLNAIEGQSGFILLLLHMINIMSKSPSPEDQAIVQSGSVFFKNVIKRRWSAEDSHARINDSDKVNIKMHLINLMCTSPPSVQKQLAEAVSIISNSDFPRNWESLLPQLTEKLHARDLYLTHGVMLTANCIFKRFRNAFKDDDLMSDLLASLIGFQEPLLIVFTQTADLLQNPAIASSKEQLEAVLDTLRLVSRVFYSLNWQDIPEYFEDHIADWMPRFGALLQYSNPLVEDASEDTQSGPVERLKTAIIDNVTLYATKYEEEFAAHLGSFTQTIWQLLVSVPGAPKYDALASISIKFLSSVCVKQSNVYLFNDEVLRQIVEQIVVPNLMSTEADEELFEDNPMDYIHKDMEGSDTDTRRRCAMELVRALLKFFPVQTTNLCKGYINHMLQQYSATGCSDWKSKDAALNLVLAVSVGSGSSILQGASTTSINTNIDVLEIFNTHVFPELNDPAVDARPIVKADTIKLVCTFRNFFPAPLLLQLIPPLIRHLSCQYVVVQTYAAVCIEKFLTVKENPSTKLPLRLNKTDITPHLNNLFSALFVVLDNRDLPENDYVMKCIMRVLAIVGSDILPVTELVLQRLTAALERVCRNPINPQFNHFMFECIALLIRSCCIDASSFDRFESLLFPPMQAVLQLDVVEFVPYVFQIFAQLLNSRTAAGLSPAYAALLPPLMSPVLWEAKGNIPALTDLIKAYVGRGFGEIVAMQQLTPIMGIFQKLLSAKTSETQAFRILNAIITSASLDALTPYLNTIIGLLLRRLQDNQTPKFAKHFIGFLCCFSATFSPIPLFSILESMQPDMTLTLISQFWHPNASGLLASLNTDAETVPAMTQSIIMGTVRMLTESHFCQDINKWAILMSCFLPVLSVTVSGQGSVDLQGDQYDDEAGDFSTVLEAKEFDSTYSKLIYSKSVSNAVANSEQLVRSAVTSLAGICKADQRFAGVIGQTLMAVDIEGGAKQNLASIFQGVGIAI